MQIGKAIKSGIYAISHGRELVHVERWKNTQLVASFIVAVAALVAALGWDFSITADDAEAGAAFIGALVNGYLVLATSRRVGPGRNRPERMRELPPGPPSDYREIGDEEYPDAEPPEPDRRRGLDSVSDSRPFLDDDYR